MSALRARRSVNVCPGLLTAELGLSWFPPGGQNLQQRFMSPLHPHSPQVRLKTPGIFFLSDFFFSFFFLNIMLLMFWESFPLNFSLINNNYLGIITTQLVPLLISVSYIQPLFYEFMCQSGCFHPQGRHPPSPPSKQSVVCRLRAFWISQLKAQTQTFPGLATSAVQPCHPGARCPPSFCSARLSIPMRPSMVLKQQQHFPVSLFSLFQKACNPFYSSLVLPNFTMSMAGDR